MSWTAQATVIAGQVMTAAFWNTYVRDDSTHLFTIAWPIGSVYENGAVATNPATLFGFGTWVAYAAGKVTVAINAGDGEFDTLNETGGTKTHTLTKAEIPGLDANVKSSDGPTSPLFSSSALAGTGGVLSATAGLVTGGGGAHNNLQPYQVVHRWIRTA